MTEKADDIATENTDGIMARIAGMGKKIVTGVGILIFALIYMFCPDPIEMLWNILHSFGVK